MLHPQRRNTRLSENQTHRLSLRAIEIFVATVEEKSLGGGARRLGASASSVSQHLANLEESLGTRLIDRTARPFAMTEAGKMFHRRALTILDEIGRARADLARLDASAVRELSLAVIEELEPDVLPTIVAGLSADYPDCNFIVRAGHSHHNIAALERRAVDLIVTADADNLPDWVERHTILHDPLVLVAARNLDIGRRADPTKLMQAPMIRFTREQMLARQIEAHLRRVRLAPPRRFEVETNRSMMATMIQETGWGITTALGFLSARRFHDDVTVSRLPSAEHARDLTVCARREVLGDLPTEVATELREILRTTILPGSVKTMPWLKDTFCIPKGE